MRDSPSAGALYTGNGHSISSTPAPPFDGPNGLIHSRPACRLLGDVGTPVPLGVHLIYVAPINARDSGIDPADLVQMVMCLDRGGWIALHGADEEAVNATAATIMALAGGGRA